MTIKPTKEEFEEHRAQLTTTPAANELDRILSMAPVDLDKLYSGAIREALHELQIFRARENYVMSLVDSVLGVWFEGSDEPLVPPPEEQQGEAQSVIFCDDEQVERWFPKGHAERCERTSPSLAEWERKE